MTVPDRLLGPEQILDLDAEAADRLLDRLERTVPARPTVVPLDGGTLEEAVVFGDTHGDWRSTRDFVTLWQSKPDRFLVGLGDYIDRPPDDCPGGSVANALFLLELAALHPERVVLLQGNHETQRRIPVVPHTLPEEIDELWGPEEERYHRLLGLLERGAFVATTASGVYLSHAGFPRAAATSRWREALEPLDEDRIVELVWAECDASRSRRGVVPPWTERDLDDFLRASGFGLVLRGHDPDVTGRALYHGRCLTLQTTRIYERYGGVIVAVVPLRDRLASVERMIVHHLAVEGKSFAGP